MRKSTPVYAAFLGALFAARLGCQQPPTAAPAPPASQLVLGTLVEPARLDPMYTQISGARELLALVYRGLTRRNDRFELEPQLARAVPTITATHTVCWAIRQARWSNGDVLDRQSVLRGFEYARDARHESTLFSIQEKIKRVEALNKNDLIVHWKTYFQDYADPNTHPLWPASNNNAINFEETSNGPYQIIQWVRGSHIVFTRNPHWYGPKPHIERMIVRFLQSEESLELALAAGEIDAVGEAAGLSLEAAERLVPRLAESHVVEFRRSGLLLHLSPRLDHPLFKERIVRRFLSQHINREELGRLVYGRRFQSTTSIFSDQIPAPVLQPAEKLRAQQDIQLWLSTKPEPVVLQFAAGSIASERAALYLAEQLRKIEIPVRTETLPLSVLTQRLTEHQQAALVLFALRTDPDWTGYSILHSAGGQNHSGYRSTATDKLLDAAASTRGAAQKNKQAIEALVQQDLPIIPLVFRQTVSIRPRDLREWRPTGTTVPVTWNAESWQRAPVGTHQSSTVHSREL